MKTKTKEKIMTFRLEEEEKLKLEKNAEKLNRSVGNVLRMLVKKFNKKGV